MSRRRSCTAARCTPGRPARARVGPVGVAQDPVGFAGPETAVDLAVDDVDREDDGQECAACQPARHGRRFGRGVHRRDAQDPGERGSEGARAAHPDALRSRRDRPAANDRGRGLVADDRPPESRRTRRRRSCSSRSTRQGCSGPRHCRRPRPRRHPTSSRATQLLGQDNGPGVRRGVGSVLCDALLGEGVAAFDDEGDHRDDRDEGEAEDHDDLAALRSPRHRPRRAGDAVWCMVLASLAG